MSSAARSGATPLWPGRGLSGPLYADHPSAWGPSPYAGRLPHADGPPPTPPFAPQEPAYPGWAAEPDARIVTATRSAIERVTGRPASVKALHAGLECGILKTALPGCQCVSFGPTITGAHSPAERVEIDTVAPFFAATRGLLRDLALAGQN